MSHQRILLIASFAESVDKFRGALIQALRRSGAVVNVAVPDFSGVVDLRLLQAKLHIGLYDIPLRRNGTNPIADIALLLRLHRLMRQQRPSVILPYTIKPVIYGTIAAWIAGVPNRYALVTGVGYAFTGSRQGLVTRVVRVLYRFALSKTHKVFFQNPDDERMFRDLGLLSAEVPSVVVNGSGIDVEAFSVRPLHLIKRECTYGFRSCKDCRSKFQSTRARTGFSFP